MRTRLNPLTGLLPFFLSLSASGAVLFVDVNSTNPAPPYAGWSTAAANIQDAIDAASPGDSVLVSDGVYQGGGRVVYGSLTNRVVINKAITVQSVNGAAATVILGAGPIGDNAVRCVYLTNNAFLSGFSLVNGASRGAGDAVEEQSGGGAWCESTNSVLLNCVMSSNAAQEYGGGVYGGICASCEIGGNAAASGGGAYGGLLYSCTLATNVAAGSGGGSYGGALNGCSLLANSAEDGGGAYDSALTACTVAWNTNSGEGAGLNGCLAEGCVISSNTGMEGLGGGAYICWLTNCLISSNSALSGGGAYGCFLTNCTISSNLAAGGFPSRGGGGGVLFGTLYNCQVIGNQAPDGPGGGGYGGSFYNCLICGNSADESSGVYDGNLVNCTVVGHTNSYAVANGDLDNCVVYDNASNYLGGDFSFSCTWPLPWGPGNFTNDPLFVNPAGGNFRLQSNSPCINAGNNASVIGVIDLDGNPRIAGGTVDAGAYEFPNPSSVICYAWLQQYGLPTDGSADYIDSDGDGMNNWQEWITGTDPTDPASVLKMLSPSPHYSGLAVTWQSVNDRIYYLQRSTNLLLQPAFMSMRSNLVGQTGTTTFTDFTATNSGPYFYRVGVQPQASGDGGHEGPHLQLPAPLQTP
jgi:hypothetical protein